MTTPTSRVSLVNEPGQVSVLKHVTILRPTPTSTQVLVKVAYAGLNYMNVAQRFGSFPTPFPFIPGREGSGRIIEVGSEVQYGFKVGDCVAFMAPSTYPEYVAVDVVHLDKLPDHISYEQGHGAALVAQGLTAWSLVSRAYPVQKNDWAVIHTAAGGVGLIFSQLARRLGAHVIGTVSSEDGAKYVVVIPRNSSYEGLEQKVQELTNGKGVHAVFDSIGKDTFESSINIARLAGTLILFGSTSGSIPDFNIMRLMPKTLEVTWVVDVLEGEDAVKLEISKVYEFEDIQQVHLDFEGRKSTGKLLLKVAGDI
ncbi:NADPH:quinone reductase [Linnemannia exigua]|uniref:NADPH:quinone reductase n=1 Tax=Linnemannia exigua TaxID=604196 RepID=A0AAD4DA54_9FUNG|nr:NADPH:quinone reductase [Linnemannia exigua]